MNTSKADNDTRKNHCAMCQGTGWYISLFWDGAEVQCSHPEQHQSETDYSKKGAKR